MDTIKLIVLIIQYLALLVLFSEFLYAVCQPPSETQKHVIVLTVATIIMFAGYLLELRATNMEEALAGAVFSYIGKPYVMLASFLFLCSYYNRKIPKPLHIALTVYCAFFPVLLFTNRYHHLYYATTGFDPEAVFSPLTITHGPLYKTYTISAVVFFVFCLWVIITGYRNSTGKARHKLAVYSAMMVISGISGYTVYLTGLTGDYDSTMLGVFFGVLFLFLIFVRCRIFDVVSAAKDHALDNSSTALFVYDNQETLTYRNKRAADLSKDRKLLESLSINRNLTSYRTADDRTFSVVRNDMTSNGIRLGESVELSDVTDEYNYRVRLERDVKQRTDELETMQRQMIGSIANIVEARSLETGEHIKRTSAFAKQICESLRANGEYSLSLSDEYIGMLVSAMPLHDIGKISISDNILLKPGKLTPEEFEIMKTHAENGARIIETSMEGLESEESLRMAVNIARYHHERWDGTGYPKGLKGEEIPLEARIAALADCFDAIMSKRCYKDPVDRPDAVKIVQLESGTHFEPCIVDALVRSLKQ